MRNYLCKQNKLLYLYCTVFILYCTVGNQIICTVFLSIPAYWYFFFRGCHWYLTSTTLGLWMATFVGFSANQILVQTHTKTTGSLWPIENLMSCRGQSASHPQTVPLYLTQGGNWTAYSHLIWPHHCNSRPAGKHNRPPWHWPSITRTLYYPLDGHLDP